MGLVDLIARLEQEAHSRVEAVHRDTDTEVRAIEAATERAVSEVTAGHLERGRIQRLPAEQRAVAAARQQVRAAELEARYAQIGRILARARALMPEFARSEAYAAAVPLHIDEALGFLKGLQPQIRCQAAFASLVEAALSRHPGATIVIDDSVGPGIIAEAADGSVTVDNTLAARLLRAEPRLAIDLARKLDDGPG